MNFFFEYFFSFLLLLKFAQFSFFNDRTIENDVDGQIRIIIDVLLSFSRCWRRFFARFVFLKVAKTKLRQFLFFSKSNWAKIFSIESTKGTRRNQRITAERARFSGVKWRRDFLLLESIVFSSTSCKKCFRIAFVYFHKNKSSLILNFDQSDSTRRLFTARSSFR